jgi:hypothetical protein
VTPVGYRVEAIAYVPEGLTKLYHLGDGFDPDLRLALRWLRGRASEIADHEGDEAPQFAVSLYQWLSDDRTWATYLDQLLHGQPVIHADASAEVVFEFTVRPVVAG